MKSITFQILLLTIVISISSCSDDSDPSNTNDCVFEQNDDDLDGIIDETERSLMEECAKNAFISNSDIEDNLIGEWELIGHGEGWLPTISQPCGYVTFAKSAYSMELHNGLIDTSISGSWFIESIENTSGTSFVLKTDSQFSPLTGAKFCPKYFYADATPRDGNMYLYEKVE